VYWMSWYVPLTVCAFINALLGAATAKTLPVHVYETTYFSGILGSIFFLLLALIGSSMLVATIQGTRRRGVIWLVLIMMAAVWMPYLTMNVQSSFFIDVDSTTSEYGSSLYTPVKLFWLNRITTVRANQLTEIDENGNIITNTNATSTCNLPLISEQEANFYKTDAERAEVSPDQFFLGCFASAGWGATTWTPHGKTKIGLAVWWFFPYFHFTTIWGNFCGYTGNPNTEFTSQQAGMTSGELARDALPVPPSDSNAQGTTLVPQGSMLQHVQPIGRYECETPSDFGFGCEKYLSNCPAQDLAGGTYNLCSVVAASPDCMTIPEPSPAEGKSLYFMFGMLLSLSISYMLMAAYWGIVFVGGAGTYPFYFIFLPSYWWSGGAGKSVSLHRSSAAANGVPHEEDGPVTTTTIHTSQRPNAGAVQVIGVSKSYGNVEALKPVTFEMARGEVTALLGHNGAGTSIIKLPDLCV
jgi:ABC-type multidrug transport system fused ATPase/permease subunit